MARETIAQISLRLADAIGEARLYPGSRWRHNRTQNEYYVKRVMVNEADMRLVVAYIPTQELGKRVPVTFVRPLNEFCERFTLLRV